MNETSLLTGIDERLARAAGVRDVARIHPMLPSRDQMLRSFLERDPSAEGVFYAAVTSTGIYCRPTCRARKPRPENIEFFPSPHDAEAHGFRACKLCRPELLLVTTPPLVKRLLDLISPRSGERLSDKRLQEMNIDPSTARRQFQRYFGMSFQQYQRSRQLGTAREQLASGDLVANAQVKHGFLSATGFRTAFAKQFGANPGAHGAAKTCLWMRQYATPLGTMIGVADDRGLHVCDFLDRRGLPRQLELLTARNHCVLTPGDHPILVELAIQLTSYWRGSRLTFTLPLAAKGSPWELRVWAYLQGIPPGQTRTYGEVASALGLPLSRRAVGRANGANYLEVVVPCHRVIRADGSTCGYGGGLWRKEWLLAHERKYLVQSG